MNPESLNEVKSLAGKIDKQSMGQKSIHQKPKRETKNSKGAYKKRLQENQVKVNLRGGNILQQKFDETIRYHPVTQESKIVYENYLGRIYELVEDQPQQTLISIADQILSCLKSDQNDQQKKAIMQQIIGQKISQQNFLNISNIAKNIKDYDLEDTEQFNDAIIMEDEDEEENQDNEQYVAEEIVDEQEEPQDHVKKNEMKHEQNEQKEGILSTNQIHAQWLRNQLAQYYDSTQILAIEQQVLNILGKQSKLQVENGLLSLLDYEKYELIKLLLLNKQKIYYLTRYHQTSNPKEKEALKQQMKSKNILIHSKNQTKTDQKTMTNQIPKIDEEETIRFRQAKEQDLLRLPKKKIDLNYHDTTDYISKKQEYKFRLPEGATKNQKPGYEELIIPARKNQIKTQLIEISSLPAWMQPVFTGIKRFNPIQSKVLDHVLNTNENMLVCAPTSAGKTNIALLSILEVISNYIREDSTIDLRSFKIVYIAPMKALVSQITGNLSNKLKSLNITVKQLTGDMHLTKTQIQETQVIVSTPEKWDIITRKAGERIFTEKVKLLIIDEIHLLSDSRGPVLQSLIARTIRQVEKTQQQTRIVGLSATLPNYKDVGLTLRVNPKKGLFYFDQSYRPIPLEQVYIGITEKKGVRKMMMMNEILYEKVIERVSNQQIIIFVHSRRDTVRTAKALRQTAYTRDELNKILRPDSQSKKILQAIANQETITSKDLKQLLVDGIGIHHAGLSRPDRDLVEELFADRHLNILVSTATLAWGVNLPAHTVIIKGTQVYSPQQGRWVEISLQDIMQMLGRAGRPHFDTEGQGMIITGYEQIRYYLGLLNLQIPLQSQMLKSLPDQLNAQIVLGTVNNLRDAVNWLSYTYLYIRMLKNPKHYSIPLQQLEQDPQLLKRRLNLIHTAGLILENNGLIHYDKKNGTFSSTFLGKIASHYYIKHSSMTIYNSNLKNNSGLIQLFKIFAMSSEFEYLVVRQEEKNELKKLIQTVPVPIKGSLEESSTKICALLQAYISRLPLEGYALNVDKVYVTQSASRIMRGLFEICLKRGWGQAAIKTLQLSKMIDKSMWSCLNPLRQFKQIPEYVLSRLEKKQQFSWQSFYQMNPQEIGDLTKFPKLGKILHKFVHHVPRVQLDAYAQPLTRSSLKVELNVKGEFKWEDQHHGREEGFWLFVLDCNEENILFSYYFVLRKDQMTFSLQFVVPLFEIMHPLYFIKVVSDRWITTNSSLPLSFRNIVLPQKFSPPTQLLDLQPVPVSQLPPLAKSLKISFLNQIQTQAYHSIVDSEQNVFIGSSEGSGKFTLTLFAMQNVLASKRKVVLIEPLQQLANSKFHTLSKLFSQYKVGKTFNELAKDSQVLLGNDLIISTPEAWEVISRRWKVRKGFEKIGLLVVNGIHMIAQEKGTTLQVVISRMRSISQLNENIKFRIIATSASVADYKELSEWIGAPAEHTYNFHPSVRSNNFQIVFSSQDQIMRESRTHIMQKSLFQMVKHFNRSNIIITNSRKQAKISSIDFVTLLQSQTNPKRFLKISEEQFKSLEKKISDKFLLHVLSYGIGYIYQGMNIVEREIIEKLFEIEGINILFVDEALKWEIQHLKAFLVAVLDCQKYSCRKSRWVDYSICEMTRFMGLSRLSERDRQKGGEYSSSKFVILCESAKKNFYKKFLFQPYPLESNLHMQISDALNSAIVSKSVQTKQECIDWLSWTFFYRRIIQNPNYYNLQQVTEESISAYLSELIENSIEYLESVKCVEVEEDEEKSVLTATNFGIICGYYSIKVETLARFVAGLTENVKLKTLIQLVCQAVELQDITYRPNQYEVINQFLVSQSQSAQSKPEALLLLYFFRSKLSQELTYEQTKIVPIALKLVHSLVDIISSLGFLKPIILTMQLCQMLIQGMWITDPALVQIMDKKLANKIVESKDIKTITQFINMEDDQRESLLKGHNIEEIAQKCNRYPIMNLSSEIIQIQDQEVRLKVTLARDEQLESLNVMSCSYPEAKEELWWVVVGEKKSNRVLITKRIVVKGSVDQVLQFQKVQGVDNYVIYALCDSYMGCDQAQDLNLSEAIAQEKAQQDQ